MTDLFTTEGFAPHGFCLAWEPALMAGWVIANAVIALAYLMIAGVLAWTTFSPRPPVPRWVTGSFGLFIFMCGLSHIIDDITLYVPIYRLQVPEMLLTAVVSLVTAFALIGVRINPEQAQARTVPAARPPSAGTSGSLTEAP